MTHTIRAPLSFEHDIIDALLEAAFDSMEEVHLIHALRDSGEMMREQVLEENGRIVGYTALSTMVAPAGWLCLAPIAVAPEIQGKGYGVKLVKRVAEIANEAGPEVVVLGKPSFYEASGFSNERAANLISPYPVKYTSLAGPMDGAPAEELIYPEAFSKMS